MMFFLPSPLTHSPTAPLNACALQGRVSCGVDVKTPLKAAIRSLVVPGLGDFYLGHKLTAVLEMVGSAVGWLILASTAVSALTGKGNWADFFVWLVLVAIGHSVDAVITYQQGKKGLYSLDNKLPTEKRQKLLTPAATGGSATPVATH